MPRLRINDREVEVPKGTSVLDAIFHAGYDVPYFCSERHLSPIGACRMCLVKAGAPRKGPDGEWIKDENGEVKIFWFPKLMASCTLEATEGMVVDTLADEVKKAQAGMIEFHLINHPLDCPTCDKGGACELQDRSYEYGLFEKYYTETQNGLKTVLYSRFDFTKRHADKHHKLSEFIVLDRERCIHCKRCVRYFEEIPGQEVLDFIERGNHTFIGTEDGLPPGFSGNITDICPVGALLDLTARFRARNWEFEKTPTYDLNDAFGAAIWVDARSGRLERIRARENPETNEIWISDAARFGHAWVNQDRLRAPLVRKNGELVEVSMEEATVALAAGLGQAKRGEIGLFLASDSTLEEGLALVEAAEWLGTPHLDFENRTPYPVSNFEPVTYSDLLAADFALVIGDPEAEMPGLYLRLQEFLKGLKPAPRYYHGTPIANLAIKERMPRKKEKIAAFATYPTGLMRFAGVKGVYAPGSAVRLLAALDARLNKRAAPEVPGVPAEVLDQAAARFLAAGRRVLVLGAEVLFDPEAARIAEKLARGKGAQVLVMPPAANARGLEAVGVWPGQGEGGPRVGVYIGALPADDALAPGFKAVFTSHLDARARAVADVVFPAKTFYEKAGGFVNAEGRLLELAPAPVAPLASLDGLEAVRLVLSALGKAAPFARVAEARQRLHERYKIPLKAPEEGWLWRPRPRLATTRAPEEGGLFLRPTMWRARQLVDERVRLATGEPELWAGRAEAARLGLAEGMRVEVATPYGATQARVRVKDGLPEDGLYLSALGHGPGRRVGYKLLVPQGGAA